MTALFDDPDTFVTVWEFVEPGEAQMAKSLLESAGVECFLANENFSRLYGGALYTQLQVHKKDEADALKILNSVDDQPDEELDGED